MNDPTLDRSARRARLHWLGGSAALVLALAFVLLPSHASAQTGPTGCGYATPGSGTYASTICWLDLSTYDDVLARSPLGQPFTVSLPGGYTISLRARTTDVGGTPRPALTTTRSLPTWPLGALGNPSYPGAYAGIAGQPAWYIEGPLGFKGATLTLDNIVVTDSAGTPVSGYAIVFGEAESSSITEDTTWTSDAPISFLETLNPSGAGGCNESVLTGVGTTSVTCTGRGNWTFDAPPPTQSWSSVLLRSVAPTRVSQEIVTSTANASVFGIMVSKIQVSKSVVGRVRGTDSFDLSATSPEGNTVGSASTGSANSATTGELTVLPSSTSSYVLAEAITPGSGTLMSDYGQSWACTRNGVADPGLSTDGGTARAVSPQPGDFIACTVTNTPLPARSELRIARAQEQFDLQVTKTANDRTLVIGQRATYRVVVRNNGPAAAPGVTLTDTLNAPVTVVSVRATQGSCERRIPMSCQLGTIASGESVTITIVAEHRESRCGQRNAASATGNGTDSNPANSTDTVDVCVRKVGLRLSKVASVSTVRAGETFSYRIRVRNPTEGEARNVRVCDRLPSGLSYVSSRPRAEGSGGRQCWTIRSLTAGQSRTLQITVRAARGTDGRKTNTATLSSPDTTQLRARDAVRVLGVATPVTG